jgi:tRNA-specific 2-thiouridylase
VLRRGASAEGPAREAARLLGREPTVLDLADEFEDRIIRPFIRAYAEGLTPSPCVACNPAVKFGLLREAAARAGARFIATGHYAGLRDTPDGPALVRSQATAKDQTYFLCRLTPDIIARIVLPLAGLTKDQARELARASGLPPREESQEICFLAGEDYRDFLKSRLGEAGFTPGDFTDPSGRIMGRHQGIAAYTVGQRRGLGLPGPEPYYVLAIDPARNRVILGTKSQTRSRRLIVRDPVWSIGRPPADRFDCLVQIRSRHKPAPAKVRLPEPNRVEVEFEETQSSIAAGQAAAFYNGEILLGGGWIIPEGNEVL